MRAVAMEEALAAAGTGPYQRRLLGIFGLVWAAEAMQVLAVGFTAPGIAASFGIGIPQALQTGTAFFLGMLVGASLFGRLADRVGRRRVLIGTVLMDALFGLLSALAPDYATLLVLRGLTGLAVGGTLPVDYALMAEFLPARRRGRWLVALEGFWAVGTVAIAVAAWAVARAGAEEGWRILFALIAAPALVGLVLRLWVPESPQFLLRTGRTEEARGVLERVARTNRRTLPDGPLEAVAPARAPASALLAGPLRRRSLLILAVWLLVSVAYYGVFVWLPSRLALEGHGFLRGHGFLVLVALAQLPGYALAAYGVERWGRRATLVGFLLASAAGCLLYVAAAAPVPLAGATLLMSFALLGTWGALYAFTPELYPTTLRATGMGAAGAMARLGGLMAPSAIAPVVAAGFSAAIGLFALLLLLAALAAHAIDAETRDLPLA